MVICNRFQQRLANNGKITTFTKVPLFDAFVRKFPSRKSRLGTSKSTFNAESFVLQLVHVYRNWFRRNSLLQCVSQSEIANKSIKTHIYRSRSSKVIEFGANQEPEYDFLLVINSNLGPISHGYWDTATYWLKIAIFSTPSHLALSLGVTLFEFREKLYGS